MSTFAYKKLLEEHKLTVAELPEEAQVGISAIKEITHAISMTEKRGQKVSPKVLAKLKTLDTWTTREIVAYVEDKTTDEEIPFTAEEVIEEISTETPPPNPPASENDDDDAKQAAKEEAAEAAQAMLGTAIDGELAALFSKGVKTTNIDEIQSSCPKTHKQIFDTYAEGESNGVITVNYTFLETNEKNIFELKKK